jgi:hypothetical protein
MVTRKKPVPRNRTGAKKQPRRRAKTEALAVSEPVIREPVRVASVNSQFELLHALMSWSPASIVVGQQAAFWRGFAESAGVGARPPEPVRRQRRSARSTRQHD